MADVLIDEMIMANEYDMIVLPGGADGAENFANDTILTKMLKK